MTAPEGPNTESCACRYRPADAAYRRKVVGDTTGEGSKTAVDMGIGSVGDKYRSTHGDEEAVGGNERVEEGLVEYEQGEAAEWMEMKAVARRELWQLTRWEKEREKEKGKEGGERERRWGQELQGEGLKARVAVR